MKIAVLERLGHWGVVGIGLLLFCLSFHFSTIAPLRAELAGLEAENDALTTSARRQVDGAGAARPLPPLTQAPELLKQLDALAGKHGVSVERATYRLKSREGERRLEISMPLRVAYPGLRGYLRDALALAATASLDELDLQRGQAGDTSVDAQVRLSYAFAAAP